MMKFNFPFHIVSLSPWPLLTSMSIMFLMMGLLDFFNSSKIILLIFSKILLMLIIFQWWRDIIRESTYQGMHTNYVVRGLNWGMLLFILSELMFFISFFWSYFHLMLSPSIEIGIQNPSFGLEVFDPYNIPLLNTVILLSSGVFITLCHHSIMNNKCFLSKFSLFMTILLGMIFTYFQYIEYNESYFTMNDSMYGSIFFLATGFHGIHVLIGSIFNSVNLMRLFNGQFSNYHHFGFEASSWYWHFVDVIWLFLYIFFYWLSY